MVHIIQDKRGEIFSNRRDYEFTQRAYEIMTDEEERMSEHRAVELTRESLMKYAEDIRRFAEWSESPKRKKIDIRAA